jgi:hypothetical protein
MAVVHRAVRRRDDGSQEVVALKRLLPHLAEDAAFIRAFAREARVAQGLHHENICRIHELGRVGDSYFISMELLEGSDLRALLRRAYVRRSSAPLDAALSLLVQLCAALDHAHNATDPDSGELLGLVHRDVSPANLLVTIDGTVKVIDFGIAKATLASFQTETGRFRGKLGYLSPEAIQGQPVDGRSDIFSVGVIAYELVTGRPLFGSVSDFETLSRVQFGKVDPPSSQNPAVPPALDEAIMAALAKDPSDRWPSAATMREALAEVAPGPSKAALAAWVTAARQEAAAAPEPRGTGQARAARASGSPTEQVVDLVWSGGARPDAAGLPDVPDLAAQPPAPLPPKGAIPPAGPDHGTVQMWALEPRPRGKRGKRPASAPALALPMAPPAQLSDDSERDTIAMPPLARLPGAGDEVDPHGATVEMEPLRFDTVDMEPLRSDTVDMEPLRSDTVEMAALERFAGATVKVAPLARPPTGREAPVRARWDLLQLAVAAVLLLLSPFGREEPARAAGSPPPAASSVALPDRPAAAPPPVSAAPLRCRLRVTSRPRRALVWLDDQVLGETPIDTEVACAGGRLAIEKRRYQTAVRSLSFAATSEATIDVSLSKRRRD